jgi:hypothetical protein
VDEADGGVAEGSHDLGGVAGPDGGAILIEDDIADPMDAILNGLIANDKICVVRHVRLARTPACRSLPRGQPRPPTPKYLSGEIDRRGGCAEAGVAHST